MKLIKSVLTIVAIALAVGAFIARSQYSWIVTAIAFLVSVVVFCSTIWKNDNTPVLSLLIKWKKIIFNRQCGVRRYSEDTYIFLTGEAEKLEKEIQQLYEDLKIAEASVDDEEERLEKMNM